MNRAWALLLATSLRENVLDNGDFSVFDLCNVLYRGTDDERGDAARLWVVLGNRDSRGDGEGIVGDVARR